MAINIHRTTRKGSAFPRRRGYWFWVGRECASQRRAFLESLGGPNSRRLAAWSTSAACFGNRKGWAPSRWAGGFELNRISDLEFEEL